MTQLTGSQFRLVLVGFANGDVQHIQVKKSQDIEQFSTQEGAKVGALSDGGFRTVVATVWLDDDDELARLEYATIWKENIADIVIDWQHQMEASRELYTRCLGSDISSSNLIELCEQAKKS